MNSSTHPSKRNLTISSIFREEQQIFRSCLVDSSSCSWSWCDGRRLWFLGAEWRCGRLDRSPSVITCTLIDFFVEFSCRIVFCAFLGNCLAILVSCFARGCLRTVSRISNSSDSSNALNCRDLDQNSLRIVSEMLEDDYYCSVLFCCSPRLYKIAGRVVRVL